MRYPLVVVVVVSASVVTCTHDNRVSEFGRYDGYSEAQFDEWVTTSQYVEMRDGVRIAIDVTRPARNGEPVDERFPVLFMHSRYPRHPVAGSPDREIRSVVDAMSDLQWLVRHGYVVTSAAVRGAGASFGRHEGMYSETETEDAVELIDWLSRQSWSTGDVGMYFLSYMGFTQYMAASEKPEALKAIFPAMAGFDLYDFVYPGGVYRSDMVQQWSPIVRSLDSGDAPPVDGDADGALLQAAVAEHANNWDAEFEFASSRYRDVRRPELNWEELGPSGVLTELNDAAVPSYHWNGWFDLFTTDATIIFANYVGPQKLVIGPWAHSRMSDTTINNDRDRLTAMEQLRWFDYWLKGIDNDVMDDAPIHYAVMVHPNEWRWVSADRWPPVAGEAVMYFAAGRSGSVESSNDGFLVTSAPLEGGVDEYTVDFTTTTGTSTRWDNGSGGAPVMEYPDMTPNDSKSLTFTTAPLDRDILVVGHPVFTIYLSSTTTDVDVFVLLEEVDSNGVSHYVTEGVLRASHRTRAEAPWNNMGLPYHRSYENDRALLRPGDVVELKQDLHPTAIVFNAGHRIRVTVMGADADNAERVPIEGVPRINLYRTSEYPSGIVLPVMP